MGKTVLLAILVAAVPALLFAGGAALMDRLSHRGERRDPKPLNLRFHYDVDAVDGYWGSLVKRPLGEERPGETQLDAERRFLELDLVFPFLYAGAFAGGLLVAWARFGRPFPPAWIVAPLALTMIADWTENLVQLGQIARYAEHGKGALGERWIQVASAATATKLAGAYGAFAALFLAAGTLIVCALRSR